MKKILARPGSILLRTLTGSDSVRWLNVELHRSNSLRVDLLGLTSKDELIHVEFQSQNERLFWAREGEYGFAISRQYGSYPKQIVLYTGQKPMRMKSHIRAPDLQFRFHLFDIRDLDTGVLLASGNPSDNVMAVLTRNGGERKTVRQVLERIAAAQPKEREEALAELMMLAGLPDLGTTIVREVKQMPILNDIMDHDFLGPKLRQAQAEAELSVLLGLAEQRFGAISPATRKRLTALSFDQIHEAVFRILKVRRVEDLLTQ